MKTANEQTNTDTKPTLTTAVTEECETSCAGSDEDLVLSMKSKLIDHDQASELADLFKALGDPTRVKMLYALLQSELCVHDLSEILEMGQSAISHQLRYLRNLRIVKRRREGKTMYYSLDDHHIETIFLQTLNHVKHG